MLERRLSSVIDRYYENTYDDAVEMKKAIYVESFFSLIRENKKEAVEQVLKTQPEALYSVSNLRQTALHIACQYDRQEILAVLLSKMPKDINAKKRFIDFRDTEGFTALMVCADNSRTECAKMLMSHQPDLKVVGYDLKRNVAHLAAQKNSDEILRMVLSVKNEKGEPVLNVDEASRDKTARGFTPAHFAASNFAHKSICVLKEFGADINVQADGKTPLMIAFQSGSRAVASYLLAQPDIDLTIRDKRGYLSFHYAHAFRASKKERQQIKVMTERQFQMKNPKFVSKHRSDILAPENTHEKE